MKKWMFLLSLCCSAFLMTACGENATPLVETVPIPGQDYSIGKYEVTQAQYQAVMGKNPSENKGDDLPVENVSWGGVMAFCEKLTQMEREAGRLSPGKRYTLPTSAQWEYACRAGTTTEYNTGDGLEALDRAGWYDGNSDETHPVGQKEPNAWGLYDMHGNVAEWCLDGRASLRFVRGGGFPCWYGVLTSSSLEVFSRDDRYGDLGFRVALVSQDQ